ncbi:MAG: thiopeptide-type bacteriocin biosynthesis protein [Phenylobacterium sp.]|jgi:thiopeptide-type bacteriocin biosynthesis protein
MSKAMSKTNIKHQDFFVIRTPRMPLTALDALGTDVVQTRQALKNWMAKPQVKEALYLASPSLLERLEPAMAKPSSLPSEESSEQPPSALGDKKAKKNQLKQQKKLEQALLKYMIRMCSRPTPFGLFSGIHMGQFGDETHILSDDLNLDNRKTRLDIFYLSALKEHFLQANARSNQLQYYPNSSHYFVADHCRYIEAYQSDETRQYRLSAIESDEHFCFLLSEAKKGVNFDQLVTSFVQQYPEAEQEEVVDYVQALIDEGVLIGDIPLPLTGDSPDTTLVGSLSKIGESDTAEQLTKVLAQLQNVDNQQRGEVADYKQILTQLTDLPVKAQENKLFQSDIYRSFSHCQLEQHQLKGLLKQLKLLKGLGKQRPETFTDFIKRFNQRFEGQFVPLDRLLDEESGISFSSETGYEAPLLAGLHLNSNRSATPPGNVATKLDLLIIEQMSLPQNQGAAVLQLSSNKLTEALDKPVDDDQLPASFAAMVSLYVDKTADGERPLLKFCGCFGPSAANLLGRFCHLNEGLKDNLVSHLNNESNHSKDVIFAEIVHMPEGRPGNVIARPHLRQYEIVFLADSSLADQYQIPLSDLHVWVEGGKIKLWSKRLNKQVIPRLSSAHNYSSRSLSAYKFLSMLQHQYAVPPMFGLPGALESARFSPRIMLDNLILAEKTWRIPRKDLEKLLNNTAENQDDELDNKQWQSLKSEYQLDDQVCYAIRDNVLQLNLTNPMMLAVLLSETKGHINVELKEALGVIYKTPVKSAEGESYANEVIIPLFNANATVHHHYHDDPQANISAKPIKRRFSPGSEWLSIKIYCGNTAGDALLSEYLLPLIELCAPYYKKWFFIRYGDPDWHLRLRFYGEPADLCGQLLPKLSNLLDPMVENGEIHKVELFTYEREVERYGGPASMALIESLFMADAVLVAKTGQLEGDCEQELRWRIAMLMTDQLLTAFNYTSAQKLTLISSLRAGFGKEFSESNQLRKQLGVKFKDLQEQMKTDFELYKKDESEIDNEAHTLYLKVRQLVKDWYQQALPTIEALNQLIASDGGIKCAKDSLLGSLLHMHNNRMFKAYGREHELVMHDFLRRYYFSANKRG